MKKITEGMRGDSLEVQSGGVVIVHSGGALDVRDGARIQSAESFAMPKAAGKGFKVDPEFPTFGWRDITDIVTTPQYRHRIDEVIMSGPSATATLMDRDDIEVDGLVLATLKLTTLPTLGGGGKLFVHTCDLHYQSTNLATKQRAPNFYD